MVFTAGSPGMILYTIVVTVTAGAAVDAWRANNLIAATLFVIGGGGIALTLLFEGLP